MLRGGRFVLAVVQDARNGCHYICTRKGGKTEKCTKGSKTGAIFEGFYVNYPSDIILDAKRNATAGGG